MSTQLSEAKEALETLPIVEPAKQGKITNRPTAWKPGQSGNPNGRPKKDWTWKTLLEEVAEQATEVKDKEGVVKGRFIFKDLVAKKLFKLAAAGDLMAIKMLMDRMDGLLGKESGGEGENETPHVNIDTQ